MAKYRKKPVVIEAKKYELGMEDCWGYLDRDDKVVFLYNGLGQVVHPGHVQRLVPAIMTLEGPHAILPGDYIITGVKGERYPCKPDIFELTYEPAE